VSDTIAVPADYLAKASMDGSDGTTLCPACKFGRLHPFFVSFPLNVGAARGWHGADYLVGFVAVCQGAKAGEHYIETDQAPCGFSLPMTARTYEQDRRERAS
jgi:hypothetical protein